VNLLWRDKLVPVLNGGEWSALPRGKRPRYPLDKWPGGPKILSGSRGEKNNPCSWKEPNSLSLGIQSLAQPLYWLSYRGSKFSLLWLTICSVAGHVAYSEEWGFVVQTTQRFGRTYRFQLQGRRVNQERNEHKMAESWACWRWRQCIPPKRRAYSELSGVTTHEATGGRISTYCFRKRKNRTIFFLYRSIRADKIAWPSQIAQLEESTWCFAISEQLKPIICRVAYITDQCRDSWTHRFCTSVVKSHHLTRFWASLIQLLSSRHFFLWFILV
jgi:hypothetical protein